MLGGCSHGGHPLKAVPALEVVRVRLEHLRTTPTALDYQWPWNAHRVFSWSLFLAGLVGVVPKIRLFAGLSERRVGRRYDDETRRAVERKSKKMRFCLRSIIAALLIAIPAAGFAASCTTQAAMTPEDRATLASIGEQLSDAVLRQDTSALQSILLPAISGQWQGIHDAIENAAPLVKGGKAELRNIYLLDATTLTAPSDTQFFCSNANGSMTVTINMHALPPGKYALILSDATGAALAGQMGFVLVWDTTGAPGWKLGGFSARQGQFGGHDAVWYWTRARELAQGNLPWAAWYTYETARYLELPVDFLSSPNLDKLAQEQEQIKGGPGADSFPYSVTSGDRTWKIDGVRLDASLHEPDLGVSYESTGSTTDPAVLRTEAIAVVGALLKAQPGLRENFHGMWAYASVNGKVTPVMELPMAQIP